MEKSVLFTLILIPSKEVQGKGKKNAAAETGNRKDCHRKTVHQSALPMQK